MKGLPAGVRNSSLAALARELSLGKLLPLALAIFALFGLFGPVIDIFSLGRLPPAVVFRNTVLSGLVSLGYAFGMMRRNWWLFAAAVAVQVTWIAGFGRAIPLEPGGVANGAQLRADGIVVLVLMFVSYTSFLAFINIPASSYLRVRAEIDLAHEIHQVLVPAIDRRVGPFEFFGVSSPSGEVGGDLVDVVETSGGWLGYVADVSGHGVSSGVVMGMFKSALRMRLRLPGGLGDLLRDLNGVLFPLKSSAMYVTAACVRGGEGAALEYAVAGHLPILLVRGDRVEEATTPQIPVGMFENYAFASASIDCEPGDLLVLLTDGLIEVFDARDRELGLDAIKTLLAASASRPLREIADAVVARARGHGKQLDDQTLLLIRRL